MGQFREEVIRVVPFAMPQRYWMIAVMTMVEFVHRDLSDLHARTPTCAAVKVAKIHQPHTPVGDFRNRFQRSSAYTPSLPNGLDCVTYTAHSVHTSLKANLHKSQLED